MTEVVQDFTTPDRSGIHTGTSLDHLEDKTEFCSQDATEHKKTADLAKKPNTVTPPESGSREENSAAKEDQDGDGGSPLPVAALNNVDSPEDENKQVRIVGDYREEQESGNGGMSIESPESTSSSSSQRGLVSRRGGRYGSPARAAPKAKEAVLEYKTYRSPPRKVKTEEIDNVPSLCSTNSTVDQKEASTSVPSSESTKQDSAASSEEQEGDRKPMSVSCDTTMIRTTSPLTGSQEADRPSHDTKAKQAKAPHNSVPQQGRKNNVTFSPKPAQRERAAERAVRTPTRSPTGSHFHSLPSLDDAALKSPVGMFLSPHPPTPSNYRSLDEIDALAKQDDKPSSKQDNKPHVRSPKTRDQERERFVATPTDFAMDYGKMHPNSSLFDTSNGEYCGFVGVIVFLRTPFHDY
jgi:hypothetical protein